MLFDATQTLKEGSTLKAVFLVNKKEEAVLFKVIPRIEKKSRSRPSLIKSVFHFQNRNLLLNL